MKYCSTCGNKIENNENFCPNCGQKINNISPNNYNNQKKSKLAAGLLAIFLGTLGIHNFYLGYNNKAIAQLLLTLIGGWLCGIGAIVSRIWALVEGVQILTGTINKDANGNILSE